MIGNLSFSDPVVVEETKTAIGVILGLYSERVAIEFHGDATEELKTRVLKDADLFVLPTYHEGFCVPVLEALASGCKVIAYDNSNLPSITGGFAQLSPTGDVSALSKSIAATLAEVSSPSWRAGDAPGYRDYALRVGDYVRAFSPANCSQNFLNLIQKITGSTDALVALDGE
jgi:glycosyltransferase involved in cell wall biosynthesis